MEITAYVNRFANGDWFAIDQVAGHATGHAHYVTTTNVAEATIYTTEDEATYIAVVHNRRHPERPVTVTTITITVKP